MRRQLKVTHLETELRLQKSHNDIFHRMVWMEDISRLALFTEKTDE